MPSAPSATSGDAPSGVAGSQGCSPVLGRMTGSCRPLGRLSGTTAAPAAPRRCLAPRMTDGTQGFHGPSSRSVPPPRGEPQGQGGSARRRSRALQPQGGRCRQRCVERRGAPCPKLVFRVPLHRSGTPFTGESGPLCRRWFHIFMTVSPFVSI